jgi:hypothetical protein
MGTQVIEEGQFIVAACHCTRGRVAISRETGWSAALTPDASRPAIAR